MIKRDQFSNLSVRVLTVSLQAAGIFDLEVGASIKKMPKNPNKSISCMLGFIEFVGTTCCVDPYVAINVWMFATA